MFAYMFTPHCTRTPDALVYNGRLSLRPLQQRHINISVIIITIIIIIDVEVAVVALTFRTLSTERRAARGKQ